MQAHHEGLPAAATVEQAIILAQLQILRKLQRHPVRSEGAIPMVMPSSLRSG